MFGGSNRELVHQIAYLSHDGLPQWFKSLAEIRQLIDPALDAFWINAEIADDVCSRMSRVGTPAVKRLTPTVLKVTGQRQGLVTTLLAVQDRLDNGCAALEVVQGELEDYYMRLLS